MKHVYFAKSVRIWSCSGPYFPNTDIFTQWWFRPVPDDWKNKYECFTEIHIHALIEPKILIWKNKICVLQRFGYVGLYLCYIGIS